MSDNMDAKLPFMIVKTTFLAMAAVLAITLIGSVMALLSFILTILVIGFFVWLPLHMLFGADGPWHSYWQKGKVVLHRTCELGYGAWQTIVCHSRGTLSSAGRLGRLLGTLLLEVVCGIAIGVLIVAIGLPNESKVLVYVGAGLLGGLIGLMVGFAQISRTQATS